MGAFADLLYVEHRTGGSMRGLSCVLGLARRRGTLLTIAGVVPNADPLPFGEPLTAGASFRREERLRLWRRRLRRLEAFAASRDVPVRTVLLRGDIARAVGERVREAGHDVVVKVAADDPLGWPWRIGGTDRDLLRHCPCSVWLLHPAQNGAPGVVLAGVDGHGRGVELDRRVLRVAAAVAGGAGAELHVVHAWSVPGESVLADPIRGVSRSRLRGLLSSTVERERGSVVRLVESELPGLGSKVATPRGSAVRAIRHAARRTGADVVVLGATERAGLEAVVFGNVAERVLGRVPASVLAVRPPVRRAVLDGADRARAGAERPVAAPRTPAMSSRGAVEARA